MPMLMEKKDWTQAVSSFATQDRVWQEDVSGDKNVVSLSLPESGRYRVFLIKIDETKPSRRSAHDLIGYGRKYGGEPRTSADWMHEIREGDEA